MLSIPHMRQPAAQRHRDDETTRDDRNETAVFQRPASSSTALVLSSGPRYLATPSRCLARQSDPQQTAVELRRRQRRQQRRRSKNCKNLLKFGYKYAGFQRSGDHREERMSDALSLVQQEVMELERRRALLESLYFSRHANARQVAADKIHDYYAHFALGYDPTRSETRSRLLESIVRSVLQEDVQSPAFQSIDQFLNQWANYSKYHSSVTITIQSIQLLEVDNPDSVVVKCAGVTKFRISRDTIKHFFQPIMNDETLVQQLIGKEYCFPFATLFHFGTQTGRVFRMEPRADLATGLLNLVADPFSTVKLLDASQLTSEGCLHAYPATAPVAPETMILAAPTTTSSDSDTTICLLPQADADAA